MDMHSLNSASENVSRPFQFRSWWRGIQPSGLSTPTARPLARSTIHWSTRMFSPNPGHTKLPSVSRRNQLTEKIRGGLGTLRPNDSQWLM